ncbi:MAG: efflux RND transporter permease subunit, partial [Candidatus Dadabacteria bacterium]
RVISLIVYGNQTIQHLRDLAETIRDDLSHTPGITLVELGLAPEPEIAVEIPMATLRAYNLTIEQVASEIKRRALELPGGTVRTEGGQILLRTKERRDFARQFGDIPVRYNSDGTILRLNQVAQIKETFRENDREAYFNGLPAVMLEVYRVGDETPQSVAAAVKKYIEKLKSRLPDNVGVKVWEDRSEIYQDRMHLLLKNAALGLVLVLLLLSLFLEARLAFWVMLGIPVSIMGSFVFFPLTGASINMISLFAFIVTLGIVVDDAIVMGENIYEKRERGMPPLQAAIEGAHEISVPVFFAVATNIVAFLPLFFVPGISGKFFMQIPSVVVLVFIISLIEALFILPSHLSHKQASSRFWDKLNRPRDRFAVLLTDFIKNSYRPFAEKAVRNRYLTVAIAIAALLVAVGSVAGGHVHFTFLPKIDADLITAQVKLPVGAPIEESRRVARVLSRAAERVLQANGGMRISKGIYSQIGGSLVGFGPGPNPAATAAGSELVAVQVSLVSPSLREISGGDFARKWRAEVGNVPGIDSINFKSNTGASEGAAIEFNLSHRLRHTAEKAAAELKKILETYKGVFDIDDGVSGGKQQISFKISPQAQAAGLSAGELARQVRNAFYGAEALRQQRGRSEVKVMVRLPLEERKTEQTLDQFVVTLPDGSEMALSDAVIAKRGHSYTAINRRNGRRIVTVTADVDQNLANANQINNTIMETEIPKLQKKYPGLSYSLGGEQEAQRDTMGALGTGFLITLFVLYALLAMPFKSYLQPALVMISIPFGIIGAVIGHFLLGYGLSIISMFGLIALSGVVVNDSMVLVVTANRLRDNGLSPERAVIEAGVRRFRPIILTSLTTFFGLAPMIFETSLQARFLIPMAISLGFGILFATLITLVLVPALYVIVGNGAKRRSN